MFPFAFGGQRQIKTSVGHLASLDESQIGIVTEALGQIQAPINSRGIRTAGERVHNKISRLSDDEWESVLGLLLQSLSTDEFLEFLDSMDVIEKDERGKVQKILDVVGSDEAIRKLIATDRLLERGPRLQHLRWFCDVRTQFLGSLSKQATSEPYVPREEVRLPIVIFRMKIDEVDQALYFQMSASELDDHLAMLQRARDELRCIEKGLGS
jgi:hypothetical protein